MRKMSNISKLIVTVESHKGSKEIKTVSVFDNRTNSCWTFDQIKERGIKAFSDLSDLKETLNWNLDGDSSKFRFKWGQSGKDSTTGYAYIVE